jgi:hypothetical protein
MYAAPPFSQLVSVNFQLIFDTKSHQLREGTPEKQQLSAVTFRGERSREKCLNYRIVEKHAQKIA